MAIDIQHHRTLLGLVALTCLVAATVVALPGSAAAAETPRRGGVLLAAIGADAPSLDPHQESTRTGGCT